ncbi:efflux RND transporter permease subunit [Acidisphaera sp. S103]|uniref:efflux RND transporter permease subunit n=1 Tax=Acidisphaera sp. S103 TaxID=1747223 RepID=UPI00131B48F4|nr:efflux RND transporter permease subunit [Acidisphaera sp. S103]
MGLVIYALKFRVTFYVMSVLILLAGIGGYIVMPKDVLPEVNIPVVTIVWTYTGLDTPTMERRVTTYSEFALSNNVNGIRNMESTTLQGVTITRVYFQPDVSIDLALSQVTAATNSVRAALPPGINPPVVMRFSASTVPVIQLALSSNQENERQLYDYAQYRIRQTLTTVPGSTLPSPYGGAPRQIMVDLDLHALQAYGLTPADVTNAMTAQNITVPSGLAKFGTQQYVVRLNSTPEAIATLNEVPVKIVNGSPILVRDVAYVRDGGPPQQNIVRQDGVRGVLLTILKNGNASTLSVVNTVKSLLPGIRAAAPKDMKITPLFDQSTFVAGAISDVIREGAIAAGLTGLMILLFLGSWRSTLIVLVSIPLSILTSLAVLAALGETVNIMTLGGLALAVGILVDDATVAIENTYRLLEEGKEFKHAVVYGAAGIAKPALISTLSICCAFVSVTFLTDAPKFLFTPQALAVVFGMLASYVLSRTLVPILIDVLVKHEHHGHDPHATPTNVFGHIRAGFERGFTKFHRGYVGLLHAVLLHRVMTLSVVGSIMACAAVLFMFVGTDYFPAIDAGQMTLHVRAPPGMRIEQAEVLFQQVEDTIRQVVPRNELGTIIDNIGLPASNYNFAFGNGTFVAYNDGEVLVTLAPEHGSTFAYQKRLRTILHQRFPDAIFYFEAADMITQILDFGVPAQIDVQVNGRHPAKDLQVAQTIASKLRLVRGAVDVHVQQITNAPEFFVQVDRQRAAELGLTEQQVATDMNVSLSGSFQVSPNFWSDPQTGIPYQIWVQTPEYRNDSMTSLTNTPLLISAGSASGPSPLQLLSNVATLKRGSEQTVSNHVNTQPTYDVYAAVQDRDLGGVESDLGRIVADQQKQLEAPDKIAVRGQIQSKDQAFLHIGIGLIVAMVAVYLLMVLNFQNWGDPFVVLAALPLAFCGIVASLFITQTTFSIPSLMGAIMSVGVASANSILLVTFAREHRESTGCSALQAAIAAGETRLRPVLMTAGAMFVGLLPMALGIGEGSEQNAALARAVLGGIAVGTCSTLLFVPFLYALLRGSEAKPLEDYL